MKKQLKANNLIWNLPIPENDTADEKLKILIEKMKLIDKSNYGGDEQKRQVLQMFTQMCAENNKTSSPFANDVALRALV